ncbi:MAG TPA: ATP-binding protein, partial [bacterium]|nr:ATP-binding protein [bacterium]
MKRLMWYPWSFGKLIEELQNVVDKVESQIDRLPEEHKDKNIYAIQSFRSTPLIIDEIKNLKRNRELITVAHSACYIARTVDVDETLDQNLCLLQVAHEIFRALNRLSQPDKAMQQAVQYAVNLIIDDGMEEITAQASDAGILIENIDEFVKTAWGSTTPQFNLIINEMILNKLEQIRSSRENDHTFHNLFIQNNIEAVLRLEVPARLEKILDTWIEIGEHVAPTAARMAQKKYKRPDKLSELLTEDILGRIQTAVEEGDSEKLESALSSCEESLESNLRLRLNAKPEYLEPMSEIRNKSEVDRFFDQARRLLQEQNKTALDKFRDIHFHRPGHTVAKEWYAYALTLFGQTTDIHEIIELLQDAISSEYFRLEYGWTARWNLACALRKLPKRAKECLDVLLPVLDLDFHTPDSFELCLLWAFEQDRKDVLSSILLKSSHHEAHLLAALYDIRNPSSNDQEILHNHFLRIGRVLRSVDHVFPDPAEKLVESELDRLTQEFVQNSLLDAGIEWFRQRLSVGREKIFFKNWECAARLNEIAKDLDSAWRCRERLWYCTVMNRNIRPEQKGKLLRVLLSWAEKNGYEEDGLKILRTHWKKTNFKSEDTQFWEKRLQKTPIQKRTGGPSQGTEINVVGEEEQRADQENQGGEQEKENKIHSNEDAEKILQRTAGSFKPVINVETLSVHADNAEDLIAAVQFKHPDLSQDVVSAIRAIIQFSIIFRKGVDEEKGKTIASSIRSNVEILKAKQGSCPFELIGLIEACERVAQNISVRIKSIPDLHITPPFDLKVFFGKPDVGESFSTRICARITNPSSETVEQIKVAFTSPSSFVNFSCEEVFIPNLQALAKCLAECPVEIKHGIEDNVEIRVYVVYQIRGISRSIQNSCKVPIKKLERTIPVTERYLTSRPVDVDRVDLFHGRSQELKDLMAAFANGQMRKLYFVNGIRRVGKSSLMQHLGVMNKTDVLSVLLNVETVLGGEEMTSIKFVRQLIRECIDKVKENPFYTNLPLKIPSLKRFEIDTPWAVFDDFLIEVMKFSKKRNILLCFDEIQRLVERIADKKDPMNEGFLSWLRGKVQGSSGVLIVCTGSEPYSAMRQRYEHTLWANMEPYNVSFVNKEAAKKIAETPVEPDEVTWLPESLERLWDMTEGHPWVIQIISEKSCERLNQDRRRVVFPSDVEAAADATAMDDRVSGMWWNESNGLLTLEHRKIAFLIIQNQKESRKGLNETELAEICHRAGLRNIGNLLEEMKASEVITSEKEHDDIRWRLKGAFLERHIAMLEKRERQDKSAVVTIRDDLPLALMLDWENLKIGLSKYLSKLPSEKESMLKERLETTNLAKRLYEAATRHGVPRQKWAVANWDNSFFRGDQADLRKNIRFETDMAGDSKADASDHVLRERIHEVLREHREISTYIIATSDADFLEAIRTLQKESKRVILWSLRHSINPSYKYVMSGPEAITLE